MSFRIEHRLGVPRPVTEVWETVKDIERWPEWSALYPKVQGTLRIGGRIGIEEQAPGTAAQALQPTIVDWTPDAQILWRTSAMGGLLKRTRYFELEALTETGCIFANGQLYEGFATRYVSGAYKRRMREAFEAFGEALRARVLEE